MLVSVCIRRDIKQEKALQWKRCCFLNCTCFFHLLQSQFDGNANIIMYCSSMTHVWWYVPCESTLLVSERLFQIYWAFNVWKFSMHMLDLHLGRRPGLLANLSNFTSFIMQHRRSRGLLTETLKGGREARNNNSKWNIGRGICFMTV